jgi:hypothetical protein
MINVLNILLKKYKEKSALMEQLEKAYAFESSYRKGIEFSPGIKLFAKIYSEDSFWEIDFITQDGELLIKQLDKDTVYFQSFFNGELEIERIVNLRQVHDLKDLKFALTEESFLNSLISIENGNRSFAEMVIFAIQEYRKIFNDYNKFNSFLWEDTGFNCAYELYTYISTDVSKL